MKYAIQFLSMVVVSGCWLCSSPVHAGSALSFDGVNDNVTFGAAPSLGVSNLTVECWFKRQGAGVVTSTGSGGVTTAIPLVTKGRGESDGSNVDCNFFFGINNANSALCADFEDFNTGLNHPVISTAAVGSNVWQHAAVTYQAAGTNGTWTLYLNGVPVATNTFSGTNANVVRPRFDSIQHAGIASAMTSAGTAAGFFNGLIDEVRIWNYARTAADIADNYQLEITNAVPGLIARWGLDDGSGTTCTNTVPAGVNGTLRNGPLWVAGFPFGTPINQLPSVSITNPLAGTAFVEGASVLIGAAANDTDGSVTNVAFFVDNVKIGDDATAPFSFAWANATLGAHALRAVATDDRGENNISATISISVTPVPGVGGLFFDGANDYVTFGAAPGLGVSNFTVECWFKRQGPGAITSSGSGGVTTVIPLVSKGRGESDGSNVDCNFIFGINNANHRLCADFEDLNTGLNHPVLGSTTVGSNLWQHAAVTYDSASGAWVLYLNGVADATNVIAGSGNVRVPRFDSIQHAGLATAMTSTGDPQGFFNGALDEVRIWNYARSAGQIAVGMNLQIGAAPGLIGRWGLNEGTGPTATDVATGINGNLVNGPIWVAGYPFPPAGNTPPIVLITSPTNGAAFDGPATFSINVSAGDAEGSVTNVEFFDGATGLGADTVPPFAFIWTNAPIGGHALTAVATDSEGLSATSAVVNISILVPNFPPAVVVNSPTNNAADVSQPVSLDVTVTDPEGTNLTVIFYGRPAGAAPGEDFTLMTLPDTQFYSSTLNGGLPAMFQSQTDWIIANRTNLNIAFVTHLGDIVENGDNSGNNVEWLVATNALYRLENPLTTLLASGIPYGLGVGNHDQSPIGSGDSGATAFFNQYFGVSHFVGYDYYGGHYGANNNNSFQLFSASGMEFVIIHMEYDTTPSAAVLNWADGVMKTYPERRAIVTSHWIVNTGFNATFSGQGQAMYDALKDNTNFFLMLCGHVHGEGQRSDTFEGRTVHSVLSDYQGRAGGGNGWLRYYTFSPSNNVIRARTYSPWLGQVETDADSQFELPYAMSPQNPWTTIATLTGVVSGSSPTALWSNLAPQTEYEWYVSVSDGKSVISSPLARFTTDTNYTPTPPVVSLTSPADGAVFGSPATINLAASVTDNTGSITNVAFFAGTTKLADDSLSPFAFTWNGVGNGAYTLTAVAIDSDGLSATSAPVIVSVINIVTLTNTLTSLGSTWKYLDNGSDQGTAWRVPGFNDSPWASGPAELGYGDASEGRPEATVVSFGPDANNKFVTTYFRRSFNVTNAAAYSALAMRLIRDDGVVVYLNGTEIYRNNLPGGAILFNTFGSATISGGDEAAFYLASPNPVLLVEGTNVLAVEMHQDRVNSSDISFDLELTGVQIFSSNSPPVALDATFTRAPGLTLKINIADLLANYTGDPDSDPRALQSVGASAQGAIINTNAAEILYQPANNNPDTFSYSITDGRGGIAGASINVLVVNPGGLSQNVAGGGGVVNVNFAGIPGFQYDVQHSTNLVDWTVKATIIAPFNGLFIFTETNPPSPSFYRLMQH